MLKFFVLSVVAAFLIYGVLEKKGYGLKAPDKTGSILVTPTPLVTPPPRNMITVGTCFFMPGSELEYFKVDAYDEKSDLYSFRTCHRFKGCLKEVSQEELYRFEKDFKKERILPCP